MYNNITITVHIYHNHPFKCLLHTSYTGLISPNRTTFYYYNVKNEIVLNTEYCFKIIEQID